MLTLKNINELTLLKLQSMTVGDALTLLNSNANTFHYILDNEWNLLCDYISDNLQVSFWWDYYIKYNNWTWEQWTFDTESIVLCVLANEEWNLLIWTWWSYNNYSWKISIDWWTETIYTWTWDTNGSLQVASWLVAWSEHIITIKPTTEAYGWAKAFSYATSWTVSSTDRSAYLKYIIYDMTYMWFADSATNTWNKFRDSEYRNCRNLLNTTKEYIPNTTTTIWAYFRSSQYDDCRAIKNTPEEVIPNSITTIWNYFRDEQYYNCKSLTSTADEVMSTWITTIWIHFRSNQYYGCELLTSTADEVMPTWITTIWTHFRYEQYESCKALTSARLLATNKANSSNKRYRQFSSAWDTNRPMTITIVWDILETTTSSCWLSDSKVSQIKVKSSLITDYQNSSNWSAITDSKFVVDPNQ